MSPVIAEVQTHPERLWVLLVTAVLVVVGMPRFPLVKDRFWRFVVWTAAVAIATWGLNDAAYLRVGLWWVLIAAFAISVLALLFLIERDRERSSDQPYPGMLRDMMGFML